MSFAKIAGRLRRNSRKPSDAGETTVLRPDLASFVASGSSAAGADGAKGDDSSSAKSAGSSRSFSLAFARVAQIKRLVE
ncbi:hypothetical protein PoB_001894400 [Plakobranchus ocellatus]|uniref:Uncharacterized protein n=1 Tax=Plakobranchus ocellatus TaxID=259542 RepID=A0AAV3ZEY5_9GAST|nr:hypothetical protein PoB_001894400 [Plakobranchus ocellatus]